MTIAPETIVFLIVGVHQDEAKQRRDIRKAVDAVRREGFFANTASADAIVAQAELIHIQQAQHERPVIEQ